jgi:hypothetical protein
MDNSFMKWQFKSKAERKANKEQWHEWFAWIPVRVDEHERTIVWLQKIYRRGVYHESMGDSFWVWKYKADLLEILKTAGNEKPTLLPKTQPPKKHPARRA